MPKQRWQPSIDREMLVARADLLAIIRNFFRCRDIVEVDVPVLGRRTVSDPFLEAFSSEAQTERYFLQTSPEYFMKRLLAAGAGDVFYLGKAFRKEESGRRHNAEFCMLEWYQLEINDRGLMAEVEALFGEISPQTVCERHSYEALFEQAVGVNPHTADDVEIIECAQTHCELAFVPDDRTTACDVIFSHLIEPNLQELTIVYDYPAQQCALARVEESRNGYPVARRFEVFWRGIELGNAYWELTDAEEQRRRFEADLAQRRTMGAQVPKLDESLLSALGAGLPDCAGIAMGVDRIMMALYKKGNIADVMPFPTARL